MESGVSVKRAFVILCALLALSGANAGCAQDVSFDFRGQKGEVESQFAYVPSKMVADRYFHFDDKGLRIAWSAAETPRDPVGLSWNYRGFQGDFVTIVHFELLTADASLYGTGIELYLQLNNPTGDGLPVSRLVRNDHGHVWLAQIRTGPNNARKTEGFKMAPANPEVKEGRLKLQRQGDIVTASYAEGNEESSEFEHLQYRFGRHPHGPHIRRRIRCQKCPTRRANHRRPAQNRRRRHARRCTRRPSRGHWRSACAELWAVLVLGTLSLFIFVAVLILVKRKTAKADALTDSRDLNRSATADGQSSAENSAADAQSQPIRLDCPACGKKLKLKEKFAGKRVKCPQCGGELRVPSSARHRTGPRRAFSFFRHFSKKSEVFSLSTRNSSPNFRFQVKIVSSFDRY